MNRWVLFVVGGFAGVIGFMLILVSMYVAGVGFDLEIFSNLFEPHLLRIYIFVWIFSGLGSYVPSLFPRWNNQQRSCLLVSLIVSFVVGLIVGVMGLLFTMV